MPMYFSSTNVVLHTSNFVAHVVFFFDVFEPHPLLNEFEF